MDRPTRIANDVAEAAASLTDSTLCRVWLLGPGDRCAGCAMAEECPDRSRCLHLAASVGTSRRLDGPWRRVPLGTREVGRVARDLEPHVLSGEPLVAAGLADPGWLALHRTTAFGVWPLAAEARCLGVLAFFAPREPGPAIRRALDGLGRLAGAALAGSRSAAPLEARLPARPIAPGELREAVTMVEVQRQAILATLARTGGRVSGPGGAADLLGMKPTTLESRIRRLGVRKPPRLQLR